MPAGSGNPNPRIEIAARHNAGPYRQSDQARACGNALGEAHGKVKDAMR